MRKPRDFDSELKAINERAKVLQEKKLRQLGELVAATGADALPIQTLAGALLSAVGSNDADAKEGWRKRGAAFFQGSRRISGRARQDARVAPRSVGGASPSERQDRA